MLDTNNRWSAIYARAFLGVFFFAALVAGVAFALQGDWVGVPITLCMMAVASLLWISFFPRTSEVHPGQQIGGGLRLARVSLQPGEVAVRSSMAGYAFGHRGVAKVRRLMNNLVGEAFLTDRRLIFSPYRISMRFRPTWIALRDVASVSDTGSSGWWNGYGLRTIADVRASDGSTCLFWLRDPKLLDQLREALRSPSELPESTSNLLSPEEPGLFAFIWGWGVTAGFIVMVLATEGIAGFRIFPLGLMAGAMSLLVVWNTLRTGVRLLRNRSDRENMATARRA